MAYRKKYEDSYLDDEDEEFEGDERSDTEKLIDLIQRPSRTPKQEEWVKKLTERLFEGAKLPKPLGEIAQQGLQLAATTYSDLGQTEKALALWARISDVATLIGDRELYYKAMDQIENVI